LRESSIGMTRPDGVDSNAHRIDGIMRQSGRH
jgi:hypothetical protein